MFCEEEGALTNFTFRKRVIPHQQLENTLFCILKPLSGRVVGKLKNTVRRDIINFYIPQSISAPFFLPRITETMSQDTTYMAVEVEGLEIYSCITGLAKLSRNLFGLVQAFALFDLSLLVKQEHALILTIAVSCSQRKEWPMAFKLKAEPRLHQQEAGSAGSTTRVSFVIKRIKDLPRNYLITHNTNNYMHEG